MTREKRHLPKERVDTMLYGLCLAVAELRTAEEAGAFLRDLLSYEETEMIARRLTIAELLEKGESYEMIRRETGASPGTIARVQVWLKRSGEGFRLVLARTKHAYRSGESKSKAPIERFSWREMKRKNPAYFWPELLLEEIIQSASERKKKRLRAVVAELEKSQSKTPLFKKLRTMLR